MRDTLALLLSMNSLINHHNIVSKQCIIVWESIKIGTFISILQSAFVIFKVLNCEYKNNLRIKELFHSLLCHIDAFYSTIFSNSASVITEEKLYVDLKFFI